MQEQNGSRRNYERMERYTSKEGLTSNEISLIETRDSFYMASIGENGFMAIFLDTEGNRVAFHSMK